VRAARTTSSADSGHTQLSKRNTEIGTFASMEHSFVTGIPQLLIKEHTLVFSDSPAVLFSRPPVFLFGLNFISSCRSQKVFPVISEDHFLRILSRHDLHFPKIY
jgi:hypothetical protein